LTEKSVGDKVRALVRNAQGGGGGSQTEKTQAPWHYCENIQQTPNDSVKEGKWTWGPSTRKGNLLLGGGHRPFEKTSGQGREHGRNQGGGKPGPIGLTKGMDKKNEVLPMK